MDWRFGKLLVPKFLNRYQFRFVILFDELDFQLMMSFMFDLANRIRGCSEFNVIVVVVSYIWNWRFWILWLSHRNKIWKCKCILRKRVPSYLQKLMEFHELFFFSRAILAPKHLNFCLFQWFSKFRLGVQGYLSHLNTSHMLSYADQCRGQVNKCWRSKIYMYY